MSEQAVQLQPLSEATFNAFRRLIYEKTNINMRESKHILVANRLRRRVLAMNLTGYEEYYHYLTEGPGREEELAKFIDAVSTNETYFYREPNHLDALRETILPQLFRSKRRLRIWSAGCSSGEEPYTLSILLQQGQGSLWEGEAEILATDISREMIQKAERGVYGPRSLRLVPPDVLAGYFSPVGDGCYRVQRRLRDGVEFRVHNLLQEPPPLQSADVIFCRNVMIYFDKTTQRRLADEYFAEVLDPRGFLCIGHSESLSGSSLRFHYQRGLKAPVYKL